MRFKRFNFDLIRQAVKKIFLKVNIRKTIVFALVFVLFFALVSPVFAQGSSKTREAIATVVGGLIGTIINALGRFLTQIILFFIFIFQYNDFIKAPAVVQGWSVVRDLCNMFFVVILLVIAFATILRVESYHYKKLLPRLVIMAILINFSKTICGLFIDFGQVVMLTFVKGFANAAGGELTSVLGLEKILQLYQETDQTVNFTTLATSYIMGLIFIVIALMVVLVMLIILVMRIIMLWLLVILSPLAFLLHTFPGGQKYASQWWSDFSKYIIIGPVMAFFFWLSLSVLQTTSGYEQVKNSIGDKDIGESINNDLLPASAPTQAGQFSFISSYIIAIAMLIGTMIVAQKAGVAGGAIAGRAVGGLQKTGLGALKKFSGMQAAGRMITGFRESRKKSIEEKGGPASQRLGARLFGTYAGVKETAKRPVRLAGTYTSELASRFPIFGKIPGGIKNFSNWMATSHDRSRKKLEERSGEYWRTKEAVATGTYEDKNGTRYKYDKNTGEYGKDEDWDAANNRFNAGKVVGMAKESTNKWSKFWADVAEGSRSRRMSRMSSAESFRVGEQNKRIENYQKQMSTMGVDGVRAISNDKSAPREKRMAAGIILAIKEGFRDGKEVKQAKTLLTNNSPLLDKLEETLNKRQAHLNYDFSKEADLNQFKAAVARGDIDTTKQQAAAYRDKDFIRAMKDALGKGFIEKVVTASKNTAEHSTASIEGLKKNFSQQGIHDDKGKIEQERLAHAQISGRIDESLLDNSTNKVDYNGIEELIATAKPEHIAKISESIFDPKEVFKTLKKLNPTQSDDQIQKDADAQIKEMTSRVGNNMTFAQLRSVHRGGQAPNLVRKIVDYQVNDKLKNDLDPKKQAGTLNPDEKRQYKNMDTVRTDSELASYL